MGGKTSTTTQGVSVPQEVLDRYKSINTRAENVAGTPFQTYSEDPSKFVAQITPQQAMGIGNVNAAAGAYRPYFDQAASTFSQGMQPAQPGALNTEQYMNPFQQQVIDATMRQMGQANQQAQSGALGTAIQSGAFGGDRAGIAAANLANQQGLAMGSTLAGLNAQNYGQALQTAQQQQGVSLGATQADLARLMQGGQFYAGLGQAAQQAGLQGAEAQINAGTLGQQTEQAGLSALYNQFQQKQAYPFQVAQFLANIGMGTGALSGSTTTTTQPGSFFSDRRLKENVERIGEGDNGLPIYKYRYKGEPDTHIGFMADEVEQVRPEAVGLHPTGYKTVDYDRATKASGGVAGPYGSAAGSQPSGVAGYVPEAYLPVGELLMADPGALQQARQSFAEQLQAAANFGNSIKDLEGNWQWAKDKWGGEGREQAVGEAEQARGVAGYASGGPAYLNAGLRPGDTPNDRRTYLSDTLEAQSDQDKRRDGLAGPGSAPQARTTGQDMADIAKVALAFMGMNRGGRTGYATRGGVDDETSYDALGNPISAAAEPPRTTGVVAAPVRETAVKPATLAYSGLGAANADEAALSMGSMRPKPRSAGLVPGPGMEELAAAGITGGAAPAPASAPAGAALAAEAPPAPGGGVAGASAPARVADVSGMNPTDFFYTNIVRQESGGKQFDPKTGLPLTSSAGAVGAAQVVEGTGPEAAALAGMEWDRDRWMNDKDYNLKLGEAYFLEQYRKYGSLDKAAAAYNAGPGALESAMDRATALGGSYLDYLPAETQNYVASTTGGTGVAGGAAPRADRTSGQEIDRTSAPAGLKPYDERNMLGQMMYDPETNKLSKNALLSLASGVGSMLASPSQFFLPSLGLGLQGAASTYAGLEKQTAEVTARNLENMRAVAMDTMTWNQMNGTNLTPAQYARSIGMTLNIPENASAKDILSGAYQPTTGGGAGIDKIDFNTLQTGTTTIDGKTVLMQDDPASLRRFVNDNGFFPPDSPIGRQVAIASQRLADIEARGGVTFDVNGNEVVVPSYVAAGNTQAQNQANREASIQFRNDAITRVPVIDQQLADTDKQAMIFTKLQAGALTDQLTSAAAVMDALGLPAPEGMVADKSLAQEAIKLASAKMINDLGSMPGGAPRAELDRLAQIAADPNMQPEAVKMILTMQKAALLREQDKYRMRDQWNRENPSQSMDQFAYEQWFSQNRPYTEYYEGVKKSMPTFAGEAGSVQKPIAVTNDAEFEKNVQIGQFFVGPDGVPRQRMN